MKVTKKTFGIVFLIIGMIVLLVSLYLFTNSTTAVLNLTNKLLVAMVGLLFLLLGLSNLRPAKESKTEFQAALQNIENRLTPFANWIKTKNLFSHPKFFDALCISLVVIFAAIFTLGRWNGNTPFIFLYEDAGTIATMAAAVDHPQTFAGDFLYGNQANISTYKTAHVSIVRALNRITGDYGLAVIVMIPFVITLQGIGVYLLGKKILGNRFLAILLSLFSFTPIGTGGWDYWGFIIDPLPRQLYQSLAVYVFLAAVSWRDQPKKWIWIMLALGLLTYVYPVSSIPVAFAVWLGLVLFFPKGYSKPYKWKISLGIGFLYIAVILPMIFFFKSGTFPQDFYSNPEALRFLYKTLGEFFNVSKFTVMLVKYLYWSGLLTFTTIGIVYLLRNRDKRNLPNLYIFLVWIFGICFISLGVVGIEHFIESTFSLVPLQIELIRGVRYVPFFMELILFLSISQIYEKAKSTRINYFSRLLIVLFIVFYSFGLRFNILQELDSSVSQLACLMSGRLTCQSELEKDVIDLYVNAKKILKPNTRVLSIPSGIYPYDSAARYYLLQPSGLSFTDKNRGVYVDPIQAMNLVKLEDIIDQELLVKPRRERLQVYLNHAEDLKTDVYIINLDHFDRVIPLGVTILYENKSYALISTNVEVITR